MGAERKGRREAGREGGVSKRGRKRDREGGGRREREKEGGKEDSWTYRPPLEALVAQIVPPSGDQEMRRKSVS